MAEPVTASVADDTSSDDNSPDGSTTDGAATGLFVDLPVRPGVARFLVMFAVFLCASCGMVYELGLVALGSYLLGNSIVQASIVLSVMVFAMGVGSFLTKRFTPVAALAFALIEVALGVIGGLSILVLYLAFAYLDLYTAAMVVLAFVIGTLIGAEIPLLMELIQRIRAQRASAAVADLFAADYVGGLIGGLAFPFLLLPLLGLPRGVLAVGIVNALTGVGIVLWIFRRQLKRRTRTWLALLLALVLTVLTLAWIHTESIEVTSRQRIYRDPVVTAERSQYQDIVVTVDDDSGDTRLFLNGDLQFASSDEYRYHETLVHPAMVGSRAEVLVLGGGDGMAVREILKYPDVEHVTVVDLDPAVVELARSNAHFTEFNRHAFDDPRVKYISADAFTWLRQQNAARFDVVIADLPDPDDVATSKLYSIEFYGLINRAMRDDARLVVQAGSPFFASEAYWGIGEGVARADLATTPYHVDVPSFGDWGYFLAAKGEAPPVTLSADAPGDLRFATADVLRAAQVFPPDRDRDSVAQVMPSSLLHPRVLDQESNAWVGY